MQQVHWHTTGVACTRLRVLQVKAAMVDSANDSVSSLRPALAAARQDAAKASAHAQEACAAATQREAAAAKRAASLQYASLLVWYHV